ncbi:MAG: DUF1289 domain-containing protein [Paracoccus sp. (in: a-proteobacteria)]|uniref:DUF1289 domain-containing protein n=1 Tax=Paracoccus sp. TaxID=267 RepID=UPI0026DFCFD8|nr:DUF1289 domain-containing protein [Paracoccus sp. (in: a-proteobacteria)]MDO5611616.1 DUF1289 domain-containing protein [Paracoccus sp. (in: a-proteobacteria)]
MDDRAPIWTRDEVQSPCVNICVIHPQEGICVGCYRTLDEIAAWGGMSADARRAILTELPARKPLLKKRRGGRNGRRDP